MKIHFVGSAVDQVIVRFATEVLRPAHREANLKQSARRWHAAQDALIARGRHTNLESPVPQAGSEMNVERPVVEWPERRERDVEIRTQCLKRPSRHHITTAGTCQPWMRHQNAWFGHNASINRATVRESFLPIRKVLGSLL